MKFTGPHKPTLHRNLVKWSFACQGGCYPWHRNWSLVRQLVSPTVSLATYIYNVRVVSKFLSFSFKLTEEKLQYILSLRLDSNNVSIYLIFIFSQFHASVGLSICRTIEPSTRNTIILLLTGPGVNFLHFNHQNMKFPLSW